MKIIVCTELNHFLLWRITHHYCKVVTLVSVLHLLHILVLQILPVTVIFSFCLTDLMLLIYSTLGNIQEIHPFGITTVAFYKGKYVLSINQPMM